MIAPRIGIVAPAHARDLARRVVAERLHEVVRRRLAACARVVSVHIVDLRKFVAKPLNQRLALASSYLADITQLNFGSGSQ